MAERRMFSKTIIDSDLFLDMSLSAQALYFHLSMRADDEGFINSPKKVIRMINAHDDDFRILIAKQFLIPFESGVVVIKHWKVHNYIRGDRITPTFQKLEKEQLALDNNNTYVIPENGESCLTDGSQSEDNCPTSGSRLTEECPHRLGKDRLGKVSLGKVSLDSENPETEEEKPKKLKKPTTKKPKPQKFNYAEFVLLSSDEHQKLIDQHGEVATARIIEILNNYKGANGKKYASDYMAILNWVVERYQKENPGTQNQGTPKKGNTVDYLQRMYQAAKAKEENDNG